MPSTVDANDESASKSVVPEVGKHSELHTTPTTSIEDPFFNTVDKAPHLDALIIKQEVDWFQLRAEKQ